MRRAKSSDVDTYLDLFEAVASEGRWIGSEAPIDRPVVAQKFRDRVASDSYAVFVAEEGAELVGYIGLQDRNGLIDIGMFVASGRRGKGVGTALMESAIEWAAANGAHKLTLQVWAHNTAARRLYEKFGFVQEGYLTKQWKRRSGELWDTIVMGRLLVHD